MIAGLLSSGVFGALTGLVGSAVTAWTNYKMQKLKNDHELAMVEAETKSMVAEAQAQIQVTKAKVEGEERVAEMEALKASYGELSKDTFKESYMKYVAESRWTRWWAPALIGILFAFVDVMRRAARPALTYYLVGATTWLTVMVWRLLAQSGSPIDSTAAQELLGQLVVTILYLTVSAVTWWFCDRRLAKFLMRLNDGNAKVKNPDVPF